MTDDELSVLEAVEQADLIHAGEVTPSELVESAIRRIERDNPRLNAVVTDAFDLAVAAAGGVDPTLPLAGVPFLLKDLGCTCAGVRRTCGSRYLRNLRDQRDSELVM